MTPTSELETYFANNRGRLICKWMHYFDIYERHLAKYRKRPITMLEFGVAHGGSLQMWKTYFGKKADIVGVDIEPRCKALEEKQISIHIGDQEDRTFLRNLMREVGPVDIVLDDGGHTMRQQIATFEEVYPYVSEGGVFIVEDTHTSYWPRWGGGYRREDTFIEYAKSLVDKLYAWHSEDDALQVDQFTRSTRGIHFYDSIVVFEKEAVSEPACHASGVPSFQT